MLENIHIQNFRCFEDFKVEGFERINLIGGKNNSGKTCLLEAIQCIDKNLLTIAQQRGQKSLLSLTNYDVNSNKITINFKSGKNYQVELILPNGMSDSDYERKGDRLEMKIQYIKNEIHNPEFKVGETIEKFQFDYPNPMMETLVELLQIIEPKTKSLLSHGFPDYTIAINSSNKQTSLSDFGDGLKYLLYYFINFIDKKQNNDSSESILLIDEIENGIHYTAQDEIWRALFRLSKELNVQVFATTHSKEMIEQFNIVSKEFEIINNEKTGAYFEMMRNVRTNKIVAHKYEAQDLEYSLDNEKTFRGE